MKNYHIYAVAINDLRSGKMKRVLIEGDYPLFANLFIKDHWLVTETSHLSPPRETRPYIPPPKKGLQKVPENSLEISFSKGVNKGFPNTSNGNIHVQLRGAHAKGTTIVGEQEHRAPADPKYIARAEAAHHLNTLCVTLHTSVQAR